MVTAAKESAAWRAMPFGSDRAHVDVDFNVPPPYAVTSVLAACLRGPGDARLAEQQAWGWSVASRLQGLLAVARATHPADLDISTRCQRCHETLSFSLPLENFVHAPVSSPLTCEPEGREAFEVRLPTGKDQQRWLESAGANPITMAQELVMNESVLAAWDDDLFAALELKLEQADPYTALNLESECPHCAAAVSQPLNLEGALLQRLQSALTERLRDVHRLARVYHWSEAEILALPSGRRDFYLACVSRESVQ